MIEVLNKHTASPVDIAFSVSIMRDSPLGNPHSHLDVPNTIKVSSRKEACDRYEPWLREQYAKRGPAYHELIRLVEIYRKTGSLKLLCCCVPKRCHGLFVKKAIEGILKQDRREPNDV